MDLKTGALQGCGAKMAKIQPLLYYKNSKTSESFGYSDIKSELELDIIIPAIDRDIEILKYNIDYLKINLKHPIGNIYIVGPRKSDLNMFSKDNGCIYVEDETILSIDPSEIDYFVNGCDRSGWIYQQLLKLSSEIISDKKHVFVLDADTVLIQPQKFEHQGKLILLISDEYHLPYFKTFKKIFNYPSLAPFSFVSHQMIIDTNKLKKLKKDIEKINKNKPWYNVILENLDYSQPSSFSEFETIGNWNLKNYPDSLLLEYWFNKSLKRKDVKKFFNKEIKKASSYRSVSFQHHM